MRPAEVVLAPGPKNAGGPGLRAGPGLSLGSFARAGDLGPNEDDQLAGTWQVAFLGEIEPRAARPGMLPRRVRRVGPRMSQCVNEGLAVFMDEWLELKIVVAGFVRTWDPTDAI